MITRIRTCRHQLIFILQLLRVEPLYTRIDSLTVCKHELVLINGSAPSRLVSLVCTCPDSETFFITYYGSVGRGGGHDFREVQKRSFE